MTIFDAAILGVVEGITEFLPISSTGHLILVSKLLQLPSTEFLSSFEIAIQLGAILAVVLLFWRSFLNIEMLKRIIVAFIPTAVIGLALYSIVKTYLLDNVYVVLGALFFGGVLLLIFEHFHTEGPEAVCSPETITYKQSFLIGLFQSIAIVPGVSRSAATILGGLWIGISRVAIVEFSFLLAVPTMAAATSLDLLKNYQLFSAADFKLLAVGFGVSFVVALIAIKFLLQYIRKHTFRPFGVYRILLAAFFLLLIL
ncbi:undecaprenyl-diphosphate phosphatase [Patescibacteria group bacterium]|nr:undecaprenyl-diphosphate phosphatase [Patescibacteria group bacterium]MBU1755090.1 undecaprenyl-diphosphate phosphatase [Patescibacteria group bacterium]